MTIRIAIIDEEKIINHERYDGLLAISTNAQLDEIQILDQYNQLYKIEYSFRTFNVPFGATPYVSLDRETHRRTHMSVLHRLYSAKLCTTENQQVQ